jgi:hypothetical protein
VFVIDLDDVQNEAMRAPILIAVIALSLSVIKKIQKAMEFNFYGARRVSRVTIKIKIESKIY